MLARARALVLSTHPGPGLAVTVVAVLLGVAVGLEPWRVAVLGLAMLLDQSSVGLSNDWIDAERDRAVGRRDKPVAQGAISIRVVRRCAWIAAASALLVTLPLGLSATAAHLIALASAWTYNAGFKNSRISVLPYALSFGLLPAIASLALPDPALPAWWVFAAGALLGIAAHFANVLPDFDDDQRTGVQGLPHRIGLRLSILIVWSSLLLGAAAVALGVSLHTRTPPLFGLIGLSGSALISVIGLMISVRDGVGRWAFRLVIAAALVDVIMLVLAGSRMLSTS